MKHLILITLTILVSACGTVQGPTHVPFSRKGFECRTSCDGIEPSVGFLNKYPTVFAAENHEECKDADTITRAYEELDALFFDSYASTPNIDVLFICLYQLDATVKAGN